MNKKLLIAVVGLIMMSGTALADPKSMCMARSEGLIGAVEANLNALDAPVTEGIRSFRTPCGQSSIWQRRLAFDFYNDHSYIYIEYRYPDVGYVQSNHRVCHLIGTGASCRGRTADVCENENLATYTEWVANDAPSDVGQVPLDDNGNSRNPNIGQWIDGYDDYWLEPPNSFWHLQAVTCDELEMWTPWPY